MTYCRDARLVRPQSLPTSNTPVGCAGKNLHNRVLFITFNSFSILFQVLASQNRDFCLISEVLNIDADIVLGV